jgi:glycosyltransferase involved in cell wall biosynthesis
MQGQSQRKDLSLPEGRALIVGIDARSATEVPTGCGRVVRELLHALGRRRDPHTYRCYARTAWEEPLDARFEWELVQRPDPLWHLSVARRASRDCDVFLSSNSYLTACFTTVPTVPIVYDLLAFDRRLEVNRRSVVTERVALPIAVRQGRRFLTVSDATAQALISRFPQCRSRTTVARLGVADALRVPRAGGGRAAPPANGAGQPANGAGHPADRDNPPATGYILAVGSLEPRKNLVGLVDAYRRLPQPLQDTYPLVVVGPDGWRPDAARRALESLNGRSRRLGFVPDSELAALYEGCAAFCYPSLGEGFGLPVLEGMAAGAPVITSNTAALREVGGDAVLYFDPRDGAALPAQLERVLGDATLRSELAARGRDRARQFSWDDFAERTLLALETAADVSVGIR